MFVFAAHRHETLGFAPSPDPVMCIPVYIRTCSKSSLLCEVSSSSAVCIVCQSFVISTCLVSCFYSYDASRWPQTADTDGILLSLLFEMMVISAYEGAGSPCVLSMYRAAAVIPGTYRT